MRYCARLFHQITSEVTEVEWVVINILGVGLEVAVGTSLVVYDTRNDQGTEAKGRDQGTLTGIGG